MTKWKQLDAVLSTEAGAQELHAVLVGLNVEAEQRTSSGETPGDVPMCPAVRMEFEKTANYLLIPRVVVFSSCPTAESFQDIQAAACALSVAWLTAGYCLGRQHAGEIGGVSKKD